MQHPQTPAEAYGHWLATVPGDWPAAALHSAQREFLDTIAVLVPGAREPVAQHAFATVSRWGDGPAAVAGFARKLALPWAALVNGAAAHALDFDDNFDPPKAHASTVLVPAILALADDLGASGAQCLDAYIVGLQIMGRVGQGVNPTHRNRGWHATATVGVIGAAAACARLLGLDARRAAYALSLATSQSAGFMSQFGTMAKPLHAGFAAKGGIVAASLAASGIDAGLGTFDGPTGMNTLMVGPDRDELRRHLTGAEHGQTLRFELDHVGEPLLILEHGFRVKRFPNCGSAHRAMDGLLDLMARHGFSGADVREVEVHAPAVHLNNLMYLEPVTGLQAKFSMEYALACLLDRGGCALSDFTDEAVARPEVRQYFARVRRCPVDRLESEFPTRIVVQLAGRSVETIVAMPQGSKAAPFPDEVYWRKFDDCVAGQLPDAQIERLRTALRALPNLDRVSVLTEAYRDPR